MDTRLSKRYLLSLETVMIAVLAALFFYLAYMTRLFQINPFDSYELFLNARRYAGVDNHPIYWKRAPMLPLMISPFFWLEARFFSRGFAELASRYLALGFYASWIVLGYFFLKRFLEKPLALTCVFLLAINRLLIHHSPFCKEDTPASLMTVGAFYFYLKATETGKTKHFVLTTLFITAMITMRFNLVPLPFIVIAAHEFLSGKTKLGLKPGAFGLIGKNTWKKIIFFLIIPAPMATLIPSLVYAGIGYASLLEAPAVFLKEITYFIGGAPHARSDSFIENYEFMWIACTPPIIALMIMGTISAIVRRNRQSIIFALWFFIFWLVGTYGTPIREGRYLLPFLLPFYYFVGLGIQELWDFLKNLLKEKNEGLKQTAYALTLVLILAWPVQAGFAEALKFQDPFYTRNFQKQVSEYAKAEAGENKVYWIGAMYPLFPSDYSFHKYDEFAYIYHYYNHIIRFYTGERCFAIGYPELVYPENGKYGIFIPRIGASVPDKTVLIVNPMQEDYKTENLPREIAPLVIQRVHTLPFQRVSTPQEPITLFVSPPSPNSRIAMAPQKGGFLIEGINLPDGYFELYFQLHGRERPDFYEIIKITDGKFRLDGQQIFPQAIQSAFLLNYETLRFFAHPDLPSERYY